MTNDEKRVSPIMWVFIVILLMVIVDSVMASERREAPANNIAVNSESLGLGFGMGDVDIAQCMYTKGTPVYQWGKYNLWCISDALDAKGLHDSAAKLRCSLPQIIEVFGSECLVAMTAKSPTPPPVELPNKDDEDGVQARLAALEAQRVKDTEIARKAAQRVSAYAREIEQKEREDRQYAQQTLDDLAGYRK